MGTTGQNAFASVASGLSNTAVPDGFKGQFTQIAGQRIRCYQTGEGPDILFIHGSPGSIEEWDPVMDHLSKKYRLTFFDRPGQGFSSGNNLTYSVDENADFVLAVIDKLGLENPLVVGESFGGCISMGLAVKNPGNVRAIVAACPATTDKDWKPEKLFYLLRTPVIGNLLIWLFIKSGATGMIRKGILDAAHPNEKDLTEEYIKSEISMWRQVKVLKSFSREIITPLKDMGRIASKYPAVTKKVFLIHGEDDTLVPVSHSIYAHKNIPGSKLYLLKNTGHMIVQVRTSELVEVIEGAMSL
jgi:pimeloyl-ACP methyl ester carboxylesterase